MLDEQEPSIQSARRNQSSTNLKLRKYDIFTKTWKLAIAASISANE